MNTKEIKSSADWKRNGFILNRNEKHNFIFNNVKILRYKNNYFCYVDKLNIDEINYLCDNKDEIIIKYKEWYSSTRVNGGKVKVIFTEEHRKNLKKSRAKQKIKHRTYLMCIETKEIHSATEWKFLGYREAYAVANGKQKTNHGLHFKHVNESNYDLSTSN